MRVTELDCRDTRDFQDKVKACCPQIDYVFRDAESFVAFGQNKEVRITPTLKSLSEHQRFFHGNQVPFKGEVNLPEPADFGVTDEEIKPKEEAPPTEGQPPAGETPAVPPADHSILKS